ncbi:MAG: tRNA lysidine(34) synthetase TilS [Fimbriiglobus sp.]|nr:tRNA lysidine(34) synthetase TilS [Fimbriiglobus sp.]
MSLPEHVRAAMDRLRPGWAGELGVVAVSGGADSVGLLRALVEAGGRVVVAHLNHQLRADESNGDESFVAELAGQLGVAVRTHRVSVAELGGNLEANARRVRYEWLKALTDEVGAGWIATGHTADDQAETVLHRLIRGTGLQGLRGIAPVRGNIVRPLLWVPRDDLLAYLDSQGQSFRTDSSNADTAFTRNRIRAELLPLLRTFNPAIVNVLGRLSVQAEELFAEVESETADLLRSVELPRAGEVLVLDAEKLTTLGEAKTRRVLRVLWNRERWPVTGMTFDHWRRAAMIAAGTHSAADFPDGVHVRRVGRVVQLTRTQISPPRAHEGT